MLRRFTPVREDEQLCIDPSFLTMQGSWIADQVKQPVIPQEPYDRVSSDSLHAKPRPGHHAIHDAGHTGSNSLPSLGLSGDTGAATPVLSSLNSYANESLSTESVDLKQLPPSMQETELAIQYSKPPPITPAPKAPSHKEFGIDSSPISEQSRALSRGQSRKRNASGDSPQQAPTRPALPIKTSSPATGSQDVLLSPGAWLLQHSYHVEDYSSEGVHRTKPAASLGTVTSQPVPPPTPPSSSRGSGPYYCAVDGCKEREEPFNTKSDLKHHQRKHLAKSLRPHACPECSLRFQYPKDVRRHMKAKAHGGGDMVTCHVCLKTLSRDDNLSRHLASQHGMPTTPSGFPDSSAGSPGSPSSVSLSLLSSRSEVAYSPRSPSVSLTPASPLFRTTSYTFHYSTMEPSEESDESMLDPLLRSTAGLTSVPMSRWHTT